MLTKPKALPPLDHLLAFETAARLGSFARASKELNISESAISRKVRLLEAHFSVALFARGHRSVTLTAEGLRLSHSVSQAMDILRKASHDTITRSASRGVTLAATNSVAALWLMPKLRRFRRANPQLRITLMSSDDDQACQSEEMDLAILRGDRDWPDFDAHLLFGETIFPVCAPSYAQSRNMPISTETLPECDLIEVSSNHPEWLDWSGWFRIKAAPGVIPFRAVQFNTYPLAIQGAVDGLGVALGWGHLVDPLLASGELIRPLGDDCVRTESGYYLLQRRDRTPFTEQKIVADWLIRTSDRRTRYATARTVGSSD